MTRIEQIHQFAAMISLVLLPLPGWPANIGLAILFAGLLRLPTTIKCTGELLRKPLFVFLVAWWLIAVISETWVSHPTHSLLVSPLLLLIIPALLPVLQRPRPFILAIGTGTLIHTAIQILMWFGVMSDMRYAPMTISGGLHWYPPITALWSTCVVLLLLGLILNARSWKYRVVPLLLALPLPISLALSGTRVIFLAVPIAIVFLAIKVTMISTTRRQRVVTLAVCGGIIVVCVGTLIMPGTIPNERMQNLAEQLSTSKGELETNQTTQISTRSNQSNQFVNSVGMRYLWWRAGFDIWRGSPWIGHGNGSTKYQFAIAESKMPTKYGADVSGFLIANPHSSILATAIEQGLIGIILMTAFALLAFMRSLLRGRDTTSLIGLSAAWFTVIVFSQVHTIQFSAYASTLLIVLTTLTLRLSHKTQKAS